MAQEEEFMQVGHMIHFCLRKALNTSSTFFFVGQLIINSPWKLGELETEFLMWTDMAEASFGRGPYCKLWAVRSKLLHYWAPDKMQALYISTTYAGDVRNQGNRASGA